MDVSVGQVLIKFYGHYKLSDWHLKMFQLHISRGHMSPDLLRTLLCVYSHCKTCSYIERKEMNTGLGGLQK